MVIKKCLEKRILKDLIDQGLGTNLEKWFLEK